VIALEAGDWRATLLPGLGGAIGSLDRRGEPVLRPTPDGADDPLQVACFPLVPYANRIADGRFAFGGREVRLTPTPRFEPHALHGNGWRSAWTVADVEEASATLALEHPAGEWPWAWRAEQRFALDADGLTVVLTLRNLSGEPMPAGLGLHPYFVRRADTVLRLRSDAVWLPDGSLIPRTTGRPDAVVDWSGGARVAEAPFVDHAYSGWDGLAEIAGAGPRITLTAEGSRWVHVYVPVGEDYFCVEPVNHRPNGLNAPEGEDAGVRILAPGQAATLNMRITAA
jgi:aldose 1-epimerase